MSIKSMTGFGAGSASTDAAQVTVELSSVNRKQLEVKLRLPSSWAGLEPRLQKVVQSFVSRGRVSGTVTIENLSGGPSVEINHQRAADVVASLRSQAEELGLTDDLSASVLMRIPCVLDVASAELDAEEYFPVVKQALTEALEKLVDMRVAEGLALAEDFEGRLVALEEMISIVEARSPSVLSARREKLFSALKEVGLTDFAEDERVLREVAMFGERCDIAEEITRLASHMKQFRARLASGKPVGRELDFLIQEFLREINTIGSKANDLTITEQVVAFKTELERVREQVQNVE